MHKRRLVLTCLMSATLLASSGCAPTIQAHYFQHGAQRLQPTSPDQVRIYVGDGPLPNPYVLGGVAVDVWGDSAEAIELFKEEAASIGANALIRVRATKINGFADRTGLSGIAVWFPPTPAAPVAAPAPPATVAPAAP